MYSSSQATLVHLLAAPLSLNLDHSDFQLGVKEILVDIYIYSFFIEMHAYNKNMLYESWKHVQCIIQTLQY